MAVVPVTIALGDPASVGISVLLGLLGVVLARTVFVDRENRKLGRRQPLRETIPLTLVAMLITGVMVWDNQMGFSTAVLTGLGVGWTAIFLLDLIGRRIIDPGASTRVVLPDQDPPDVK